MLRLSTSRFTLQMSVPSLPNELVESPKLGEAELTKLGAVDPSAKNTCSLFVGPMENPTRSNQTVNLQ